MSLRLIIVDMHEELRELDHDLDMTLHSAALSEEYCNPEQAQRSFADALCIEEQIALLKQALKLVQQALDL